MTLERLFGEKMPENFFKTFNVDDPEQALHQLCDLLGPFTLNEFGVVDDGDFMTMRSIALFITWQIWRPEFDEFRQARIKLLQDDNQVGYRVMFKRADDFWKDYLTTTLTKMNEYCAFTDEAYIKTRDDMFRDPDNIEGAE